MGNKRFNPDLADVLVNEERKKLLPTETIIDFMNINSTDSIADLGAGNGYFTIPIAKRTNQPIYAIDIEVRMLEKLREHAKLEALSNISYVVSGLDNISLIDNAVTKIMMSLVIHEVDSIPDVLSEVKRILRQNGQLLVIERKVMESEDGPPLVERVPPNTLIKLLEKYGFKADIVDLNNLHYGIKAELIKKEENGNGG